MRTLNTVIPLLLLISGASWSTEPLPSWAVTSERLEAVFARAGSLKKFIENPTLQQEYYNILNTSRVGGYPEWAFVQTLENL